MKALPLVLLLTAAAGAQNMARYVSLQGTVHWYNPQGTDTRPCRQCTVLLTRADSGAATQADTIRTRTDSYGQYAYYGLMRGGYVLSIPKGFGRFIRREVRVPGAADPVVLPPALPPLKDSSSAPFRVESDYEVLGTNRYRFRMRTLVPAEWKPLVDSVRYFMNHPSFTRKNMWGRDRARNFGVEYVGWGCLETVPVEVFLRHDTWTLDFAFCADLSASAARKKNPPTK